MADTGPQSDVLSRSAKGETSLETLRVFNSHTEGETNVLSTSRGAQREEHGLPAFSDSLMDPRDSGENN